MCCSIMKLCMFSKGNWTEVSVLYGTDTKGLLSLSIQSRHAPEHEIKTKETKDQ